MGTKELQNGHGTQWKRTEVQSRRPNMGANRCTVVGEGTLLMVIEAVTRAGAYISFGQTSDGGALLIRVLDGSTKMETYVHTAQELREALHVLKLEYKATWSEAAIRTD